MDPADTSTPTAAPSTPAAPAAPQAPQSAPSELQSSAPAVAPAPPATGADPAKPKSMAEAMWQRDEKGRFAGKAEGDQTQASQAAAPGTGAQAAKPVDAAKPADPNKPAEPDDITQMPEGLGAKAQERFQRLAGTVKEQAAQLEQAREAIGYVQETFQQHGVQRQQFEQAVGFIGAINRGDFAAAEQMLLGQLQQLSLMTGRDYGGAVDPLAEFPDLSQRVQGLQMTREDAIELARHRKVQAAQQQAFQQQRQAQAHAQASEQQFQRAQSAVDAWARNTAATDLDWPLIEARLLPAIPRLLNGVPPERWADVVKTQYELMKDAAREFRRPASAPAADNSPLRPAGALSPSAKASSMFDAMWSKA